MITVLMPPHNEKFRWQTDLFWFCHRRVYGADAPALAHAAVIKRNTPAEPKVEDYQWSIDIPHTMCEAFFDLGVRVPNPGTGAALNIQLGLQQILDQFDDRQILEVIDCDMLHFRPSQVKIVAEGELLVSDVYENWHLRSLTGYRCIIEPYFQNGGQYDNGGFVPIIGTASTFRRILPDWIALHADILSRPYINDILWWAGMYALQAACERARVQMVARDWCYAPEANRLSDSHYIGHYSVDKVFDKRFYPDVNTARFDLTNPYTRS